ncbi:MAG: hypothetical protein L0211_27215 [Planctomycetaceae bacterium]|nr:hypothetical protein [Planctomycetaceae bacterium]
MTSDLFEQLDVFYGELTVNRACIYARLPSPSGGEGWSLSGQVRGPRCLHAQTLPVSEPFVDQGPGPTLASRALLPDPCFWSPDLPAIYDVTIDLVRRGEVVATTRRELGLRMLGVRGRNLFLEGKRWVLRCVCTASTTARLPREWHDAVAALCSPTLRVGQELAETLSEAAQWGALTIVEIDETGQAAADRLRNLTRSPAVGIAVLRAPLGSGFHKSTVAPNLLLAQRIGPGDTLVIYEWAELAVVSAENLDEFARAIGRVSLPVVAERRLTAPQPITDARATCDALQRDLAPLGQFAGYIV